MSCDTYYPTSPDAVFEKALVLPFQTDLPVTITARQKDDDCDSSTKAPEFDFTGHTPVLEIYSDKHSLAEGALVTIPSGDFTITQNADGVAEGVNNQLQVTIDWDDLAVLDEGIQYWYRVYVLDSASVPYTPQRGPFLKELY